MGLLVQGCLRKAGLLVPGADLAGELERKTRVGQSRINRIAVFRDPGSAISPHKEIASALAARARNIIMLRSGL
jgi:hypothetical protein